MKAIFAGLALTLASATALAQPIELKPGASVVINGAVVSCQGPSEDALAPACLIKQDNGFYRLYVGTTIAESFYTFDAALKGAKDMKAAGLCR